MRASLLLSSIALTGSLLLLSERAAAQVTDSTDQGKPELNTMPPDRPSLDATPLPSGPPTAPARPVTPPPTPQDPGTFQPARPAQPRTVPKPTQPTTVPQGIGTVKPADAIIPSPPPAKWFVTGNPDLGFSSSNGISFFNIGLSAMLGYRVTERLALGPGMVYQYSSINGIGFSNVGGRIFGQALISDKFFVHLEQEVLRAQSPLFLQTSTGALVYQGTERLTVNSTFGGIGYRQQFSDRAALDILALYNLTHDENYFLYGQPEFRFNLLFNLF